MPRLTSLLTLTLTAGVGVGQALSSSTVNVNVNANIPPNDTPPAILRPDTYGYSIEPSSLTPYLQTPIARTILQTISSIIGTAPPLRIGGNIADQTLFVPDLSAPSIAEPNDTTVEVLRIRADWFRPWTTYFPPTTDFTYTLNLRNTSHAWTNAMQEAAAAMDALGDALALFELGNEIDHYISKGWRGESWGTREYTAQWKRLTGMIREAEFYKSASHRPLFQAAVFADPPWVPDQQDEVDDFDIVNVTRAGLVDHEIIKTYAVHLYPQSTCDEARRARLSLDLLSNHHVVWTNLSQYIPQREAAERVGGAPLVLGETNSASCSGQSGISDTFGAALWTADYVLTAASMGVQQVYFHLGHQSEYSAFTPLPYEYEGEELTAGVRANVYAHLFLAYVLASKDDKDNDNNNHPLRISALPSANASDFSGYAIFGGGDTHPQLEKLVFLDMGVWNASVGLSNPSTLSATDSTSVSPGQRPTREVRVHTSWPAGTELQFVRLQGPGTNAKSEVHVSGLSLDPASGEPVGEIQPEKGVVRDGGIVEVSLRQAEAVLVQLHRS